MKFLVKILNITKLNLFKLSILTMTKNLIPLVLVLFSFFLSAENKWQKVFSGSGNIDFYFDLASLSIDQEKRLIKIMINYQKKNIHSDLSTIVNREINCNEMMYRDLEQKFFKLNFGKGSESRGSGVVNNPKWKYFPPGSSGGELIKIICKIEK